MAKKKGVVKKKHTIKKRRFRRYNPLHLQTHWQIVRKKFEHVSSEDEEIAKNCFMSGALWFSELAKSAISSKKKERVLTEVLAELTAYFDGDGEYIH